jgi:hypothetical protein
VWAFEQTFGNLIKGKWLEIGNWVSQGERLNWDQQKHAPGFVTSLSKLDRQCQEHQKVLAGLGHAQPKIQWAVVSVDRWRIPQMSLVLVVVVVVVVVLVVAVRLRVGSGLAPANTDLISGDNPGKAIVKY